MPDVLRIFLMKKTKKKTIKGWVADERLVTINGPSLRKVTTLSGDVIDFPIRSRSWSPLTHVAFDGKQMGGLFHTKKDALRARWSTPRRVEVTVKLV